MTLFLLLRLYFFVHRSENKIVKSVAVPTADYVWRHDLTRTFRSNVPNTKAKCDKPAKQSETRKYPPIFPHVSKAYKLDEVRRYSPFHFPGQVNDLDIFGIALIKQIMY